MSLCTCPTCIIIIVIVIIVIIIIAIVIIVVIIVVAIVIIVVIIIIAIVIIVIILKVVSAAKTLVGHPDSESALKNMTAFQDLWIEKIKTLTEAVDKVIPLQDFIAVTGK